MLERFNDRAVLGGSIWNNFALFWKKRKGNRGSFRAIFVGGPLDSQHFGNLKGLFTVEATMLFPIVLFVLSFLVYLGFYQYNRCIVEESLRYVMIREKELSRATEEEYEGVSKDLFVEILDKHYLIGCEGKTACKMDGLSMELVYDGTMPVPWLEIGDSAVNGMWQFTVKGEVEKWDPVSFIRLCNKVKGK